MLWTGKQLFSLIIRPNRLCPVKANLQAKCSGKRYEDKSKKEYRCPECCVRQEEELRLEFPTLPVPMCNGCIIYNKYGRKEEMDPNDMCWWTVFSWLINCVRYEFTFPVVGLLNIVDVSLRLGLV